MAQALAFPEMGEEALHQIFRIMLAVTESSDVAVKRRPVDAEQFREPIACPSRILRTCIADESRASGGEERDVWLFPGHALTPILTEIRRLVTRERCQQNVACIS